MILRITAFACLYTLGFAAAADPVFTWVQGIGDFDAEPAAISVDDGGNTYTIGLYFSTNDMDPGAGTTSITSAGAADVYVLKLDSDGNFVWVRTFGGTEIDLGTAVAVDENQNVYIMGTFEGTVDLDPGTGVENFTAVDGDVFLVKLDSSGDFVWARTYDAGVNQPLRSPRSVQVDSSGNVFVTGTCANTTDFDPSGSVVTTSGGAFVLKLDTDGDLLWVTAFTSAHGQGVALDSDGSVTVIGEFEGTTDLNPGAGSASATSAGGKDVFVVRLAANGDYLWSAALGGTGEESAVSIRLNSIGAPHIVGGFSSDVDFDPGPGVAELTGGGLYVLKLTPSGVYQWAVSLPTSNNDTPDIGIGTNGDVYIAGNLTGANVDLDPGAGVELFSASPQGPFLLKLSAFGSYRWAGVLVGPGNNSVAIHPGDVIHLAGRHPGATIDYDMSAGSTTLPPIGGLSTYVLTMDDAAPTLPIRAAWIGVLIAALAVATVLSLRSPVAR